MADSTASTSIKYRVTITNNHRVVHYTSDGDYINEWPIEADSSSDVVGIHIDSIGEIIVTIDTKEVMFGIGGYVE